MSDVNTMIIEPFMKFVKDSQYLVKKCTKPDHKGKVLCRGVPSVADWIITLEMIDVLI
jgi:hypothetical protein